MRVFPRLLKKKDGFIDFYARNIHVHLWLTGLKQMFLKSCKKESIYN